MLKQQGYTLIELMIALALGLVIVAAAVMLLLTGIRSHALQQGVADLQDDANFGLNYITQDVRLANLKTTTAKIDDQMLMGGIVLSHANLPETLRSLNPALLSFGGSGISNVDQKSDQLVIQYKPMTAGGFDCQGRRIEDVSYTIVQRYFLRSDSAKNQGEEQPLSLACDSGRYTDSNNTILDYGDNGEIIMKRVDQFHVLLSISTDTNQRRYISIEDYKALGENKPRILAVYIAALTRSAQHVGKDQAIQQNNKFTLLDQDVELKNDLNLKGYIRRVVAQEVALRNALGERT
jgi:type IV pilus assembly protein PilW